MVDQKNILLIFFYSFCVFSNLDLIAFTVTAVKHYLTFRGTHEKDKKNTVHKGFSH